MIMDIGPFRFYRTHDDRSLCVSLIAFDDKPFGWEYGYPDPLRGESEPWISFRIKKLQVLYFETWKNGFEFWLFGFWIII